MTTPGYQRFFAELKRRRVFRVMAMYGAVAFVILQVADIALPGLGLPEWTITLILALTLLGFPLAIVLAWAFDMTPEGMQRTADATPAELSQIIAAPASQRWPAGVLALVGITALLAGAWYVGRQSAPAASAASADGVSSASIAVLPFADMSPDKDQEYFSDGISEELLNLLAKTPELQVAARTSSFSFKGENLEITEIARRLNVAHVLEGSVRKSGNQVRVTAQLIRADDGFHMWSETWDRSLDNIFAIQDEIAADVAAQLKVTLLGAAPVAAATDPEAYALFLQARQLGREATAESLEQSISLYLKALEIDPGYAAAWAGLARTYNRQVFIGLRPAFEARLGREAANRALAIDPDLADAHAILAFIAIGIDFDPAAAARRYQRALALDPTHPEILADAALLARDIGRSTEAIALLEYAVARDPVNPNTRQALATAYLWAGRLDEAIESYRAVTKLVPGYISTQFGIGTALLVKGDPEGALAAYTLEQGDEEYRVKGTALALHDLGRMAEFDSTFAELRERWGDRWPSEVAHVYAWIGDADAAFEWLEKAVLQNEDGLNTQFLRTFYAPLYDDPRWQAFRERTGTSEEQLAAIEFEVTLPK
ncbi:MAG: tetratricopeptide repeat protein [Gemmatimonadota bacterium]